MSQAGARSERGDEYQLRVALPWVVRLWTDPSVVAVQTESLGMPGDGVPPPVDDVVVVFADGRRLYLQAKKNHPDFGMWSVKDASLRPELVKARDQLERDANWTVQFVSRSPFGELHKLAEGARDYPDAATFAADAPATLTGPLASLAKLWDRSEEIAFELVRRIEFTVTSDYGEMDRDALAALRMLFPRPEEVHRFLEARLRSHQSRLRDPVAVYRRTDLERELADAGHVASPVRAVADQLAAFARASAIGREWERTVAEERIERAETRAVLDAVEAGARTVLVTGEPGIGKTCVLLDVADAMEQDPTRAFLFVKGDRFAGADDEAGLVRRGLPDDLVGRCARLAVDRPVVAVFDALDVLSLQRAGGTLELFLGLIDRLRRVDGVTVVTACRAFDLEFDPLLRGRTWDARVTVASLDVERDVAPILERWGVDVDGLDPGLVQLLRVPGRLWLYGQVLRDGPVERVASVYELHDRYLESVRREPGWGDQTPALLARVADRMQRRRTLEVSRGEVDAPVDVLHGLLSRGVLIETERAYAFGHQELLDVVAVRAAQREGVGLREFVAARPALPFIRPTVRVFLHVLRSESPAQFRREVGAFVSDTEIAYHLRRLVAETMAEVRPDDDDLPIVLRLMTEHGDLFERFLQRAGAEAWLGSVVDGLLPAARRSGEPERWTDRLLRHLAVWAGVRPDIVLPTWRRALDEGWPGTDDLSWTVASGLETALRNAERERVPWDDAEWLLRRLLDGPAVADPSVHAVGPAVQAWVEAGGGDDVLLEYLALEGTMGERRGGLDQRVRSLRRREGPSEIPTSFLTARMVASDDVIDAALAFVLGDAGHERRWMGLLNETSWRNRHSRSIMAHDALHDVLGALEDALAERAAAQDAWWIAHEPEFVTHEDPGVRYLALQAYSRSPEAHVDAVARVLTDPETFQFGDLESEVRELAHAVYPSLSSEAAADHQRIVLALVHDLPPDAEDWRVRVATARAYGHLVWVPRPYRTPEAEAFVESWADAIEGGRPDAEITIAGGVVTPPVSVEDLLGVSDAGVLRVVEHWGTEVTGTGLRMDLVGGWDQVVSSLRYAAKDAPERALRWLDALLDRRAPDPYLDACVGGLALHLRVRFAGLTVNGSKELPPPVLDGPDLGRRLLRLLELYGEAWIEGHTLADAVEACAAVLDDETSAARLTLLLVRLGRVEGSPISGGHQDPRLEGANTNKGKAATAAVQLATRLSERSRPLPELLPPLLRQLASDGQSGTAWAVLRSLPPLTQSAPELAWDLLDRATADAGPAEWEAAEVSLYYNYHHHEDRVGPVLERVRAGALDVAGRVYGRIGALSALSGHLDEAELWEVLEGGPPSVWAGVAEVFAINLRGAHRETCVAGLVRLLTSPGVPSEAVDQVSLVLGRAESRAWVPPVVVDALLQGPPDADDHGLRVHGVVEWAQDEVPVRPRETLSVVERLAEGLETGRFRNLYGSEIIRVLTALLREADQTDDPALIARVVSVQDRLLRLGVGDVDRMLDAASRP